MHWNQLRLSVSFAPTATQTGAAKLVPASKAGPSFLFWAAVRCYQAAVASQTISTVSSNRCEKADSNHFGKQHASLGGLDLQQRVSRRLGARADTSGVADRIPSIRGRLLKVQLPRVNSKQDCEANQAVWLHDLLGTVLQSVGRLANRPQVTRRKTYCCRSSLPRYSASKQVGKTNSSSERSRLTFEGLPLHQTARSLQAARR